MATALFRLTSSKNQAAAENREEVKDVFRLNQYEYNSAQPTRNIQRQIDMLSGSEKTSTRCYDIIRHWDDGQKILFCERA